MTPLDIKCITLKIVDIHKLGVAKLVHYYMAKKMPNSFSNYIALQNEIYEHSTRSSAAKIPLYSDLIQGWVNIAEDTMDH